VQRGKTDVLVAVALELDALCEPGVADQCLELDPQIVGHLLDERVALGMHRGAVQRMRPLARHTQEAGGLLVCARTDSRDVEQFRASLEPPRCLAVRDDPLGQRCSDARDIRQQRCARCVEIDADGVDAALDDLVELATKQRLVDVVLILTDPDRLRIQLDELGQRVLQPPGDRNGPAHRQIELGKLFPRDLRRAVDARPRLTHQDDVDCTQIVRLAHDLTHEGRRLTARRAVAHRDDLRRVSREERLELPCRLVALALSAVWIDRRTLEITTGCVDGRALAPRSESGIDTQYRALPERRCQQERAQILREDIDRRAIGAKLELDTDVALDARREQPLPAVLQRRLELARERALTPATHDAENPEPHPLGLHIDVCSEQSLGLAALDGEEAVRRNRRDLLGVVVVLLELRTLAAGLLLDRSADEEPLALEDLAHVTADVGMMRDRLSDDVARPGQRRVDIGHGELVVCVLANELTGLHAWIAIVGLLENPIGQRLEPATTGLLRTCSALLPIRKVEVFELGARLAPLDGLAKLRCQLALALNRLEHRLATLRQRFELLARLGDVPDGDLVDAAGRFLPVPGDEGHRATVVEQADDRGDPVPADIDAASHVGDEFGLSTHTVSRVWSSRGPGAPRFTGSPFILHASA